MDVFNSALRNPLPPLRKRSEPRTESDRKSDLDLPPAQHLETDDESRKKKNSRRKHRNSHLGCGTCKKRRIKCDENLPQCFNCVKGKLHCAYLNLDAPARNALRMAQYNQNLRQDRQDDKHKNDSGDEYKQRPPLEALYYPGYALYQVVPGIQAGISPGGIAPGGIAAMGQAIVPAQTGLVGSKGIPSTVTIGGSTGSSALTTISLGVVGANGLANGLGAKGQSANALGATGADADLVSGSAGPAGVMGVSNVGSIPMQTIVALPMAGYIQTPYGPMVQFQPVATMGGFLPMMQLVPGPQGSMMYSDVPVQLAPQPLQMTHANIDGQAVMLMQSARPLLDALAIPSGYASTPLVQVPYSAGSVPYLTLVPLPPPTASVPRSLVVSTSVSAPASGNDTFLPPVGLNPASVGTSPQLPDIRKEEGEPKLPPIRADDGEPQNKTPSILRLLS